MDVNLIDITYTVKRNGSNHFFFISDQIYFWGKEEG